MPYLAERRLKIIMISGYLPVTFNSISIRYDFIGCNGKIVCRICLLLDSPLMKLHSELFVEELHLIENPASICKFPSLQ